MPAEKMPAPLVQSSQSQPGHAQPVDDVNSDSPTLTKPLVPADALPPSPAPLAADEEKINTSDDNTPSGPHLYFPDIPSDNPTSTPPAAGDTASQAQPEHRIPTEDVP
jgi:hypothetical protein